MSSGAMQAHMMDDAMTSDDQDQVREAALRALE